MASFVEVTPEVEKEMAATVSMLKPKVDELNKMIPEFRQKIFERKLLLSTEGFQSMPDEYNKDFKEWMFSSSDVANSAVNDFMDKISKPYKYFDHDSYEEDERSKDPSCYVTTKNRRIILGSYGSIWIDMPLTGKLRNKMVSKWTRVSFQYFSDDDKWILRFDPTSDDLDTFDDPRANRWCKMMTTGGMNVDLTM